MKAVGEFLDVCSLPFPSWELLLYFQHCLNCVQKFHRPGPEKFPYVLPYYCNSWRPPWAAPSLWLQYGVLRLSQDLDDISTFHHNGGIKVPHLPNHRCCVNLLLPTSIKNLSSSCLCDLGEPAKLIFFSCKKKKASVLSILLRNNPTQCLNFTSV